jgi:O-methyltransferase
MIAAKINMFKTVGKGLNYLFGKQLRRSRVLIGNSLDYLHRDRAIDTNYFDQVRLSTLELVSYEIQQKKLEGSVAELGVYKGKFARYINQYFPERTLYLFDTFEGFNQADIEKEKQGSFSKGDQDFSDTSVEKVLNGMPYPGQCVPRKGFFPETAVEIDEPFVFVSLDADLYDPIYAGLQFFYPKLVSGGYIFVHDFNNEHYKGARKAVEVFCKETRTNYVPIPDSGGTAVIAK